jgi:pimeloyl-ACP methyl ester carboxylesterase
MLGVALLRERPDDIAAYVGTGQVVKLSRNNAVAYAATLAEARRRRDLRAIRTLEGLQPYPDPADGEAGPELDVLQRIQTWYGFTLSRRRRGWSRRGCCPTRSAHRSTPCATSPASSGRTGPGSPGCTADLGEFDAASYGTDFPMPLFLLLGRHDWQTPSTVAAEWFETVAAPQKSVVWFEESAHSPISDEPQRFAEALRSVVRPAVLEAHASG